MNGNQLEKYVAQRLYNCGWWALRIPRNQSGAQPFDIIAVRGNKVLAIDCKACAEPKFPLKRIEDNQWAAFVTILTRTDAIVGIVAECEDLLYFIDYEDLMNAKGSYIKLTDEHILRWLNVCGG